MNAKAASWDRLGCLFWTKGRISARPSKREIEMYLQDVGPQSNCAVIGASTKELVEVAVERRAQVAVFDFSERMCRALESAIGSINCTYHCLDIVEPLPTEMWATQDYVLADRLLNRFSWNEALAGIDFMARLLRPAGELRTAIRLGLYPMDFRMISEGKRRGTLCDFYSEQTMTIDYSAAGEILEACLLPHGEIDREVLLEWYRGRAQERRFQDKDVRALIYAARCKIPSITVLDSKQMPDADETWLYRVGIHN
jgi:hypothetical protein